MMRQETKFVTTPERTRAIRMPSRRPETTIERAVARRWGGARSPTRGSTEIVVRSTSFSVIYPGCVLNCGVTVVNEVKKDRKRKTGNEVVMQRPILFDSQYRSQHHGLIRLTKQSP